AQIKKVLEWLKVPLEAEVSITVITRPIESYKKQEQIRKCIETLQPKLTIMQEPDIYQKYIIIDNRLVWYGSINLFDFGNSDDTIMRLESRELVDELKTSSRKSSL
ncbi:phospholipase D-like domain-containing protein, partial [Dysgonomonas reticulitermitis]